MSILIGGDTKTLTVDLEKSNLRWVAEKVTGSHWGYVNVKKGSVIKRPIFCRGLKDP